MIIRRKLTANYTAIPNEILSNAGLSIEARWLLCYLLSKPDNWVVRAADIQAVGDIGRNKAYELIRELGNLGYIVKREVRNEAGVYEGVEYLVRDTPETTSDVSLSPIPCLRDADLRDTANQHHSNNGELVITDTLVTSVTKDARSRLWDSIKLVSQETGIPEKRLRPIVGKWLKILGDDASNMNTILQSALDHKPADFVSFVSAIVNTTTKRGSQSQDWMDVWK